MLGIWETDTLRDDNGNAVVLAGATFEVRDESSGALAAIYEDIDGTTPIAPHPHTLEAGQSTIRFFVDQSIRFRIVITQGEYERTLRYRSAEAKIPEFGTAAEADIGTEPGEVPTNADLPFINVKMFGAVGDGTTDDTTAIQDAIDSISTSTNRGGTIYFPRGLYRTTDTIVLPRENVILVGNGTGVSHNTGEQTAQDGSAQIIADHTDGPVIHMGHNGQQIHQLVISSSDSRREASPTSDNVGIFIAGIGQNHNAFRHVLNHVHVLKQPSHGIWSSGENGVSMIINSDVDNCGGHGLWFEGGSGSGRTTPGRTGQTDIINLRSSRNGGQGIRLGNPDPGDTPTERPYRFFLHHLELFQNCQDLDTWPSPYNLFLYGENISVSGSATSGEPFPSTPTISSMYIMGQYIRVQNHRFVGQGSSEGLYCAYIDCQGSFISRDVTLDQIRIGRAGVDSDPIDPAFFIHDNASEIKIRYNGRNSEVGSLISGTLASNLDVQFNGVQQYYGGLTSNFRSIPANITIPDDGAAYLDFRGNNAIGVLTIFGNNSSSRAGVVQFRTGDASAFTDVLSSTVDFETTTGALDGTTGTDGDLTISVSTTENRVYIENRTGGSRTYSVMFQQHTGVFQNSGIVEE